jgi:pimeloyl-ACP methyl ester carboxylesterase
VTRWRNCTQTSPLGNSRFLAPTRLLIASCLAWLVAAPTLAQAPPYELKLPAEPPYYRVRYEGSTEPGALLYPVSYTVWIPAEVKTLRGVVVHQHGCGEGSCKSGQTGAFDLHWQALALKHHCALLAPVFEQPEKADCQKWCDPRNGSAASFQRALADLGKLSAHPELATVPWALWGHSGGGHWAGGLTLLYPDRVVAAWLRSGVPPVTAVEGRPQPYTVSAAARQVPIMCNLGTKEGVTDKEGRFAGVWPGVELFYRALRAERGLTAVSIDPLSSHDVGNQRYLAIPWLDHFLTARLPAEPNQPLKALSHDSGWVAPLNAGAAEVTAPVLVSKYTSDDWGNTVWLPSESLAEAWTQYTKDSAVKDATPPPAPTQLRVDGQVLTWQAVADLESGLAGFIVERDGQELAKLPAQGKNPFGRVVFQNLSYSDTPTQPLAELRYVDATAEPGKKHEYRVIAVNTVGLKSK